MSNTTFYTSACRRGDALGKASGDMKKIKLRFIINTLSGGGAEKVLVDLLSQLDCTKYDIQLLTVSGGVHEKAVPITVRYRKILRGKARILSKIVYKLPPRVFRCLFMREPADIEIAYLEGFPTKIVSAMKTNAGKIAFVHFDMSAMNFLQDAYATKEKCRRCYEAFDKVCFVSEEAKSGFFSVAGELSNAVILHNVLNTKEIIESSKTPIPYDYGTDGMKLISLGRLTAQKAYDRLVNIAASLRETFHFELWILGDGEERDRLEKAVADKGLENVKFLGFQSNPYAFLKKADLFICSSVFEGYSTAVTEAMILGLPVLTTDCAGMNEILDGGKYGMIVPNSEQALGDGMRKILSDATLYDRMRSAARVRGEMFADSKKTVGAYDELFLEVINDASGNQRDRTGL